MGRNTMTFAQKKTIIGASAAVWKAIANLQYRMRDSGNSTRECIRVNKLVNLASDNVRYWIDRPVFELTDVDNRKTAEQFDEAWKIFQTDSLKDIIDEANDGSSI